MSDSLANAFLAISKNDAEQLKLIIKAHTTDILDDKAHVDLLSLASHLKALACAQVLIKAKSTKSNLSCLYATFIRNNNTEALSLFFKLNADKFKAKPNKPLSLLDFKTLSSKEYPHLLAGLESLISLFPLETVNSIKESPASLLKLTEEHYNKGFDSKFLFYLFLNHHTEQVLQGDNAIKMACLKACLEHQDLSLFEQVITSLSFEQGSLEKTSFADYYHKRHASYRRSHSYRHSSDFGSDYTSAKLLFTFEKMVSKIITHVDDTDSALHFLDLLKKYTENDTDLLQAAFSSQRKEDLLSNKLGTSLALKMIDNTDDIDSKKSMARQYVAYMASKSFNKHVDNVSHLLNELHERKLIEKVNRGCVDLSTQAEDVIDILSNAITDDAENLSAELMLCFAPYYPYSFLPQKRKNPANRVQVYH